MEDHGRGRGQDCTQADRRPHQRALGFPGDQFRTQLIKAPGDFDRLFEGYDELRGVAYVASPRLLLEMFDHGFDRIELVVGEELTTSYREDLASAGIQFVERLIDHVEQGRLRIWVPRKTNHSKFYLLRAACDVRVIVTSANLTDVARSARNQVNYAWYLDLKEGEPLLEQLMSDYRAQRALCDEFMGDLRDLLGRRAPDTRREVIEAWLGGVAPANADVELAATLQTVADRALGALRGDRDPIFELELPKGATAAKATQRILAPVSSSASESRVRVNSRSYVDHVRSRSGLPLLRIDRSNRTLQLGLDGEVMNLTAAPPGAEEIDGALDHLERYVDLAGQGDSPDPGYVRASIMEAMLGMFAAPFCSEIQRHRHGLLGLVDRRGPRFLYLHGNSQNGKSTFLKFGLKLMTGTMIEPLSGEHFTKSRIRDAAALGSIFPLVFDDLQVPKRPGFEEIVKSYWEVWWNEELSVPQIVISSNFDRLKPWAQSRTKRIHFDVHYGPDPSRKARLAELFREPTRLYRWFTSLYLERLASGLEATDDELEIARDAMMELYRRAQRDVPSWMPREPLEQLYDLGRRRWGELRHFGKVSPRRHRGRIELVFSDDMQHHEITGFANLLPATVKQERRGRSIVIESPEAFDAWTGESRFAWFGRIRDSVTRRERAS